MQMDSMYKVRNLVFLLVQYCSFIEARECLGRDQCSCAFDDDQSLIALHSLGNTDSTPRFKDVSSADGKTYSYNPCYPFAEGDCMQAAVCEKSTSGQTQNIGDALTAQFSYANNALAVGYSSGSGVLTVAQVNLQCDTNACEPTLVATGETDKVSYQFTLISVCACGNGCNETGPIHCTTSGFESIHPCKWCLVPIMFVACILTRSWI